MAAEHPFNPNDPAFKAKVEAMRKASKNSLADVTIRMQRITEISKEQASSGKKEEIPSAPGAQAGNGPSPSKGPFHWPSS